MLTQKSLRVIGVITALVIGSGIMPASSVLAHSLSPALPLIALPNAGHPSHTVGQASSRTGMAAAAGPVGSRFVVADQSVDTVNSKVAYNSQDQEYLVVWRNDRPANDDIYAQRVSKNGTLVGPWFSVAAGAGVERYYPHVT